MIEKQNPAKPEGIGGSKMLERMNQSHQPIRDFAFPLYDWKNHMHILDVGCGGGATIHEMLSCSSDSFIDGIDYSEVSCEKSKEMNKNYLDSRVRIQRADVVSLPFDDQTFDLVTAMETVYFWPDINQGLKEIYRVLKSKGHIMIMNEGSDPDHLDWPKIDGFMKVYRPQELISLLEEAGFKEVVCHHGDGQMICVIGMKS